MKDSVRLLLRATAGGLMAAHGAQKLFGAFDGPGLEGTKGMMSALGLEPAHYWGTAAALSEFGGGTLTALGLCEPLGEVGMLSSMAMATGKVHWGKPIFTSTGGPELPLLYSAAALALAGSDPDRYSVDGMLGIRIPGWMTALAAIAAGAAVGYGLTRQPTPPRSADEPAAEMARTTLQGGEEAQEPETTHA